MMQTPDSLTPPRLARVALALVDRRHGGILIFLGVSLAVFGLLRLGLLTHLGTEVTWDIGLVATFAWGLLFDLGWALLASIPLSLILTLLPAGWGHRAWQRNIMYGWGVLLWSGLAFLAAAEWVFWEEFGTRFNFIAVDYLVYTSEVLGNIDESYALSRIIAGIVGAGLLVTAGLHFAGFTPRWLRMLPESGSRRARAGLAWIAVGLLPAFCLHQDQIPRLTDNYQLELAKNGPWSFFHAFRDNQLDYDTFYITKPADQIFSRLREELVEDGSLMLRPEANDSLHYVDNSGMEEHPNIIQITVESLSSEFLGAFNPGSDLTPELDALARKSLVFDSVYATGTRTVRGMEALTLSLPPTPGRSIVKRPHNADLFTLGSVLRTRGYDTAFLYGGYSYFDNMNTFFSGNGYRVIDRASVGEEDVTFANAWGACDENLLDWTLREADAAHRAGKPFHHFIMTTSNHRPYTYPEGRIDLPPKVSGRAGAVKYTDYAIGRFLRQAARKPWFRNTVFVIVADHTASSAGKVEVAVERYHIPLMIYAPGGHVAPGHVKSLMSQIDYAPTLLGLLHWTYASRFLGHDVLRTPEEDHHALLGNYQKLGHIEKGHFVVLSPRRGETTYTVSLPDGALREIPNQRYHEEEAISFYAGASYLYKHGIYDALSTEEMRRYMKAGQRLARAGAAREARPVAHSKVLPSKESRSFGS